MKALVCSLCGSNSFTKEDEFFRCDFCRTKYSPAQAKSLLVEGSVSIDRSPELERIISLLSSAVDHENYSEAFSYAMKVLEIDPKNSAAWLAKARSIGWLSTPLEFNAKEMLGAFDAGYKYASDVDKAGVKLDAAVEMNRIAVVVYENSSHHTKEFIQLEEMWTQHISVAMRVIDVLERAYEWGGGRQPLDNIISCASLLIEGIRYEDFEGVASVRHLSPEFEDTLRPIISSAGQRLRAIDPSFITPQPVAQKPLMAGSGPKDSGCFVVTATMGRENSFPVVTLREFRDNILNRLPCGRSFILWYEKNGPGLADRIRQSHWLRFFTFILIVLPATAVAKFALIFNR